MTVECFNCYVTMRKEYIAHAANIKFFYVCDGCGAEIVIHNE